MCRGHNIKEIAETVGLLKERIAPIIEKVEKAHYDTKQVHGMASKSFLLIYRLQSVLGFRLYFYTCCGYH